MPAIPLSARSEEFRPPALRADPDTGKAGRPEVVFKLRVPTPTERDLISSRLYSLGVIQVSLETIRATVIDDLYNHYPADEADEHASWLDSYWQREQVTVEAARQWAEQDAQRLLDNAETGENRPAAPMPDQAVSARDKARAKLLVDDLVNRSTRIRDLSMKQQGYEREHANMLVRLHVLPSTMGLKQPIEMEPDGEKLTAAALDILRDDIGEDAWFELCVYCDNLYTLTEEERKNSVSPPGKPSGQNGSLEQDGGSEDSDGKWTGSNIGPAPTDASEPTTASSSPSSSGKRGKSKKPSQMAEA